ncbi:MAG: hypothetical protein JXM74_04570 [Fusobacteriaceae bacterium]|nr:hypothetical protein [Fusobacteriaceae bacterium]
MEQQIREKLEFKLVESNPAWVTFGKEFAEIDGVKYHRKQGTEHIYRQVGNLLECLDCGEDVLAATIEHPMPNNKFSFLGFGKARTEIVPYCPICEERPKYGVSVIKK